jgi:hypothetical protein
MAGSLLAALCISVELEAIPEAHVTLLAPLRLGVPNSSGGFGNGNTLFLWFFITTVMPRVLGNSKSPPVLNPAS